MAPDERDYLNSMNIPAFGWPPSAGDSAADYAEGIVDGLEQEVYISIDLDVLDPSLMAAVGTPEPGGMFWGDIMAVLSRVAASRRIVGFDVNELAPREGPPPAATPPRN